MGHPRTMGFAIPEGKRFLTALCRVSKWVKKKIIFGWTFPLNVKQVSIQIFWNSNILQTNAEPQHMLTILPELKLRAAQMMSLLMRDLAQTLFLDPCFEISVKNKPFHILLGNPPKSFVSWEPKICSTGSDYSHIHISSNTHTHTDSIRYPRSWEISLEFQ